MELNRWGYEESQKNRFMHVRKTLSFTTFTKVCASISMARDETIFPWRLKNLIYMDTHGAANAWAEVVLWLKSIYFNDECKLNFCLILSYIVHYVCFAFKVHNVFIFVYYTYFF